jgi:triacylglycerol lipase
MNWNLFHLCAATWLSGSSCCPKLPTSQAPPPKSVVLVHGFLENGSNFKTLRKRLEKQGVECYVARLKPSDGRGGLESIAARLKQDIDGAFGTEQSLSIVAFSMGGLVSRHYLQQLGGAARCERFITISSPHHGTRAAWLYPSKGVEQMRPSSDFLKNLAASEESLGNVELTSYRTPMDLVILPPTSSVWERAENVAFPVLLHPMMLTNHRVLDDLEKRLLK